MIAAHIHRLDARLLLAALPHIDQVDLFTIRSDFARWVSGSNRDWASWQEAWNGWTRASPQHAGRIVFTPHRCPRCRGRRLDLRRGQVCTDCMGTGKGHRPTIQAARWMPAPVREP